jgi:hypothetical protein
MKASAGHDRLLGQRLGLGQAERRLLAEADALCVFLLARRSRRRATDLRKRRPGHASPVGAAPAGATLAAAALAKAGIVGKGGRDRDQREQDKNGWNCTHGKNSLLNPHDRQCTRFVLLWKRLFGGLRSRHQLRHMAENFLKILPSRGAEILAPGASMLMRSPLSAMSSASRVPGTLAS